MFEGLVVSDLFGMTEAFRMESRLEQCLRRASREENKLNVDPGVARETRLPQAILSHAFSVKMRARAPALPVA